MLTEAAKEARRAYRRKWAKENPEKVRAQQERFWMRKAEQAKQQQAPESSPAAGGTAQ